MLNLNFEICHDLKVAIYWPPGRGTPPKIKWGDIIPLWSWYQSAVTFFSLMRPKFSCSAQISYTDTFKKIEKYQDLVSILPYAKDQIWTSHVCGFSLSAGSVIRGVIFLMRSLISSHGYKATLWDYQINKIQGWPIEMEHLRMQAMCPNKKSILGKISL